MRRSGQKKRISLAGLQPDLRLPYLKMADSRNRAAEIHRLRYRLVDERRDGRPGPLEQQLAAEMKELRQALTSAIGAVDSCARCAEGCAPPIGRWSGGRCCSANTEELFCDDELAALAASGTRSEDLVGPDSDLAGCAFRGPRGCTLAAEHRPNICVNFLCRELTQELQRRNDFGRIEKLALKLKRKLARFGKLRAERIARQRACGQG